MEASVRRRSLALVAVVAIHLVFLALLVDSSRQRTRLSGAEQVITTFIFNPVVKSAASYALRTRSAPRHSAALPPVTEATAQTPPEMTKDRSPSEEPIDWLASAHQAAREVLAAEAIEAKRNSRMGEGWWLAQEAKQSRFVHRNSFPWSRQPRRSWVDVDPATFLVTFTLGKRCQVVLFLIVPGFGCALGALNPEPGRGDLFDPKFLSQPLNIRPPAVDLLSEQP
jgi:hypothetical protein